jgi:predicted transcriptional regulator of viral defense system
MNIRVDALEPIVDSLRMKELVAGVSDRRGKIARMIHAGELIRLRRGLYATRHDLDPLCLAGSIYGPSYVSFETALSYHGLIPEAVFEITSATLRRPIEFENAFGRYRFRTVPAKVYPLGIERVTDSDVPFLIASPTKALCDRIALEPQMRSIRDVRRWAELMRLDPQIAVDHAVLRACAEGYGRPAVRLLHRAVEQSGGLAR